MAVELEVLAKKFDRFGWEADRGSAAHDRIMTDWMDALQDFPLPEVQVACRKWVFYSPRKMPNEGDIRRLILAGRKDVAKPTHLPPEPEKGPRVTTEQRIDICQELGVRTNEHGWITSLGPKRMDQASD